MEVSKIEWTDATFNPWWGCTKVSDGCKNCYAETLSAMYGHNVWVPKSPRRKMSESYWSQPVKWNAQAGRDGVRKRVFCASMADVFEGFGTMPEESHQMVEQARSRLMRLIYDTSNLDWLILTKRPDSVNDVMWDMGSDLPRNVWIGTSVEDSRVTYRINRLREIDATVRFLSVEPMIGPIPNLDLSGIHWVIVGGESGPGKRPFDPDWARPILAQCKAQGIAFFGKQWDKTRPLPDDLLVREFPRTFNDDAATRPGASTTAGSVPKTDSNSTETEEPGLSKEDV